MYAPSQVRTSSMVMKGRLSVLMPSCVTAVHHAYMRSMSWSVRSASDPPGMIARSWR